MMMTGQQLCQHFCVLWEKWNAGSAIPGELEFEEFWDELADILNAAQRMDDRL